MTTCSTSYTYFVNTNTIIKVKLNIKYNYWHLYTLTPIKVIK